MEALVTNAPVTRGTVTQGTVTQGTVTQGTVTDEPVTQGPRRLMSVGRNVLFAGVLLLGLLGAFGSLWQAGRTVPERQQSALKEVPSPTWTDEGFRQTLVALDQEFANSWNAALLEAAPEAAPLTRVRRLSLALTGTLPSLEEIRLLEAIPAESQGEWWVDHLLRDERFSHYVAERLARAYVGTEDGPFLIYRRRRFVNWLGEQLAANRPYNEVVQTLISDTGIWTDSPAVNFISVTVQEGEHKRPDEIRLAGRTSRAFLGLRIDCLQCHDDHLGTITLTSAGKPQDGKQQHFHQLAAFYSETEASLLGVHDRPREYNYKYLLKTQEETVDPQPPYQPELLPVEGTRRERLARWVTHPHNRSFARAAVNRVWALLMGRPLVEPIDDLPLDGPFPPGLQLLADDFAAHNFDLQRLIRLIASSRVARCSSAAPFPVTPNHESKLAVFPLTRLRPEQVAGALLQASSLSTIDAETHVIARLLRAQKESEFVGRYGDLGEEEFTSRGGTVTQRLLMMNGELLHEESKHNSLLNASTLIARYAPTSEAAVETAYLAILTRRPSERERLHFVERIDQRAASQSKAQVIEDLCWTLLNSTEFSWNH